MPSQSESPPADTTSGSPEVSSAVAAFLERGSSGTYDECVDQLLGLPPATALATATYNQDFQRCVQPYTGNLTYLSKDSNGEYEAIFVGEILHEFKGTKFSAKGTHYAGTALRVRFSSGPHTLP